MKKLLSASFLTLAILNITNYNSTLITHAEEYNSFETSDVLDDLKSSKEFQEEEFIIDSNVSIEEGIESIMLFEYGYHDLYLYTFNKSGKEIDNSYDFRITMSVSDEIYSYNKSYIYEYYDLTLLDYSEDFRFHKFKVDYNFVKYTDIRTYAISDFDFSKTDSFANGNSTYINEIYTYEGYGENISYSVTKLRSIEINPIFGYYRTDTLTSDSNLSMQVFTDISYLVFPVNKLYGNVVGIDISWTSILEHYSIFEEYNMFSWMYDSYKVFYEDDHLKSEDFKLTYTADDFKNSPSVDELSSWDKFLINLNPANWFYDQKNDYNLKVIEKLKYPFEDYYLNDDTIKTLKEIYSLDDYLTTDFYVIRFSYDDFINSTTVSTYFNGSYSNATYYTYRKKTDIINCEVMTLTFSFLGKTYTLPVNMQPVDIPKDWVKPTPSIYYLFSNFFDEDFLKILLRIFGAILLVIIIIYFKPIINFIVSIFKKIFSKKSKKKDEYKKKLNRNRRNE